MKKENNAYQNFCSWTQESPLLHSHLKVQSVLDSAFPGRNTYSSFEELHNILWKYKGTHTSVKEIHDILWKYKERLKRKPKLWQKEISFHFLFLFNYRLSKFISTLLRCPHLRTGHTRGNLLIKVDHDIKWNHVILYVHILDGENHDHWWWFS